jgi:hypothetical protein
MKQNFLILSNFFFLFYLLGDILTQNCLYVFYISIKFAIFVYIRLRPTS